MGIRISLSMVEAKVKLSMRINKPKTYLDGSKLMKREIISPIQKINNLGKIKITCVFRYLSVCVINVFQCVCVFFCNSRNKVCAFFVYMRLCVLVCI